MANALAVATVCIGLWNVHVIVKYLHMQELKPKGTAYHLVSNSQTCNIDDLYPV